MKPESDGYNGKIQYKYKYKGIQGDLKRKSGTKESSDSLQEMFQCSNVGNSREEVRRHNKFSRFARLLKSWIIKKSL